MNHVRSTLPEKNFSKNDVTPTIISVDYINIDSIDIDWVPLLCLETMALRENKDSRTRLIRTESAV